MMCCKMHGVQTPLKYGSRNGQSRLTFTWESALGQNEPDSAWLRLKPWGLLDIMLFTLRLLSMTGRLCFPEFGTRQHKLCKVICCYATKSLYADKIFKI